MAYIDGWDHGWRKTATLIAVIHNAASRICAALGADAKTMTQSDVEEFLDGTKCQPRSDGTKAKESNNGRTWRYEQ